MIAARKLWAPIALVIIVFAIYISPLGDTIVNFFSPAQTEISRPIMADDQSANFTFCSRSPRVNCIVDGDTFWYQSRKIRIADINTPEVSRPLCPREAAMGKQATARLHQLLNAGKFSLAIADRDQDRYGRDLRIIYRKGQSIGDIMVAEGLAHHWRGKKESWC